MTEINKWNQLYSKSLGLKQATSIHNAFTEEDISFIENRLKIILRNFLEGRELHKGIKIYVDKILRNDVVEKMASLKPNQDQSLEEWCRSIFQNEKFGVVFNSLESYDNLLTERMCKIINALIEKAGIPLGGISFLFFMGNYGFTPFGIHKEAIGEEGFLFHMGPSKKTFHTWDIAELNAIEHNTEVFHNVEEMLPDSESYELDPKSVMFIPNHLYHIANTEEFSFSVVMDYINPSQNKLDQFIAQEIGKENLNSSQSNYLEPAKLTNYSAKSVKVDMESWQQKYENTLEKYLNRLKSNHGILLPSLIEHGNNMVHDNFKIKSKTIFPLVEFESPEGELFIMARGHQIPVKKNSNLTSLINGLNSGKEFRFKELQELLVDEWQISDLYEVLSDLIEFAAVEKIDY